MCKLVLVPVCIVSLQAFAITVAKNCPPCVQADQLKQEIAKLNYSSDTDQLTGDKKVRKAATLVEAFAKTSKEDKTHSELFSSLLPLVREAAPYDSESELTGMVSTLMKKEPELKVSYRAYMSDLLASSAKKGIEFCKTQLMQNSIQEASCTMNSGLDGQDIVESKRQEAAKCIRHFNFETCLKQK
jgi:hypothetical protein